MIVRKADMGYVLKQAETTELPACHVNTELCGANTATNIPVSLCELDNVLPYVLFTFTAYYFMFITIQ